MDNGWMMMRGAMLAAEPRRKVGRQTVRRVVTFARPHRRSVVLLLLVTVGSAVIAVVTPLLAGRVVNVIIGKQGLRTVVLIAAVIAALAVVDAGLGLAGRWQASRIGEGLILDLRRAVFSHVQRMPVAFFTRTRTGALVSRLNNDVIGAQRAFTST
ncbi:MAG: ABC transporter transmembrane domain-containing protein, partial [Actinomycetota bacterium]|nr:ABC transporter transmembrane domain-containing protein [Actinomycetota bacterium]